MCKSLLTCLFLLLPVTGFAADTVYKITVDKPADEVYDRLYTELEKARFYVVFEPDIGRNLAAFARQWGSDYNRNKLDSIRAMMFCNGWYANQVSNTDPDMLGLCPLHLAVVARGGLTTVLFNRPTVIAVDSPALELLEKVETEVIAAIGNSLN